jgi:Ca2+-transporting ATPase
LLFINLVTDILPALALGTEHAEPGIMKRQPRKKDESIFSDSLGFNIIYQGIGIAIITLSTYFIVNHMHIQLLLSQGFARDLATTMSHPYAMTSAFFALSMCELFQAFTLRSLKQNMFKLKTHNKLLWITLVVSLCLTLSVIYIPPLAATFSLVPLTARELITSTAIGLTIIPIVETGKAIQRRKG